MSHHPIFFIPVTLISLLPPRLSFPWIFSLPSAIKTPPSLGFPLVSSLCTVDHRDFPKFPSCMLPAAKIFLGFLLPCCQALSFPHQWASCLSLATEIPHAKISSLFLLAHYRPPSLPPPMGFLPVTGHQDSLHRYFPGFPPFMLPASPRPWASSLHATDHRSSPYGLPSYHRCTALLPPPLGFLPVGSSLPCMLDLNLPSPICGARHLWSTLPCIVNMVLFLYYKY